MVDDATRDRRFLEQISQDGFDVGRGIASHRGSNIARMFGFAQYASTIAVRRDSLSVTRDPPDSV